MTYTLKLKEERKIGHEAGFREGMEKGMEKGLEKGLQKGTQKGKVGNCIKDAKKWYIHGNSIKMYKPSPFCY